MESERKERERLEQEKKERQKTIFRDSLKIIFDTEYTISKCVKFGICCRDLCPNYKGFYSDCHGKSNPPPKSLIDKILIDTKLTIDQLLELIETPIDLTDLDSDQFIVALVSSIQVNDPTTGNITSLSAELNFTRIVPRVRQISLSSLTG